MGKIKYMITAFGLFFSVIAKSENSVQIQTLTTKNGLSQNTVRSIIQDKNGFMWFGSLNGLNRYDGYEFECIHPQYGIKNTLSDSRIKDIREDSRGYLWIQTNINNINCFDPVTQKFLDIHPWSTQHGNIYFANNGDVWLWGSKTGCLSVKHISQGLASHFFGYRELNDYSVNILKEDSNGNIWIGTDSGLFYIENDKLHRVLSDNYFQSIIELDSELYVFTRNDKLYIIDKKSKAIKTVISYSFKKLDTALMSAVLLSDNNILITTNSDTYILNTQKYIFTTASNLFQNTDIKNAKIKFDNNKNLWIYNKTGIIWQYIPEQNKFKSYTLIPMDIVNKIDMERYSVYHDSRDIIWISTYGSGLYALDQNSGSIKHFECDDSHPNSLKTNYLLNVTEDKNGNIWVGTEYSGVAKITITENHYKPFYPGCSDHLLLNSDDKIIRLIYQDSNKNLWIGTKSGYLYIYDKNKSLLAKHRLKRGMPYTLAEDANGNKWIGTKGNGLLIFKKNEFLKYYTFNKEFHDRNSLACNIYTAYLDTKGRMWLGTFGYGLLLADFQNDKLFLQEYPELRKYQPRIRCIEQDTDNLLWVGGNNGITVFNPDLLINNKSNFKNFYFDANNDSSLNNDEVKKIFKDSNGGLWIGTSGGGLNQVIRKNNIKDITFKHYTTNEGLINDIVQGITEDDDQNIWISTESGISLMHTKNNYFENYHLSTGWDGDLFCEAAIFKSDSNKILLGSYNGLYNISPQDLIHPLKQDSVVLTEILINGSKMIPDEENSPLYKSISNTNDITLKNNQNSFNIRFSGLNFESSNIYAYILEGYEKTWNSSTQNNEATYRNVPPGNYTFKVKMKYDDNIKKQKETLLNIQIKHPLWESPQAILVYLVFLALIVAIIIRTSKKISHLNMTVNLERKLTDYKLRFFTNISHEFRTPLTIIKGTIDNLSSQNNISDPVKKQIVYLEKSSNRLLRLINQLLDYQKIQQEKPTLNFENTEVTPFFKDIYKSFEEIADRKNITYKFHSDINVYSVYLDKGIMDKIAYNLLSNAFKFTPEDGEILFDLHKDALTESLVLSVSDNGPGISNENQHLLFQRFTQINPSDTGTGIGLNFCYELIKMLKGSIKYKNSPNGGATFIVSIPLMENNKINSKKQVAIHKTESTLPSLNQESTFKEKKVQTTTEIDSKYQNYTLLIIEDDFEVSDYLSDYFRQYFNVETASNGQDGLKLCKMINPHIIICDAMMPKMNGYEFIKRIKSEFQTCHIPVVMLTAYASPQHQLQGITAGADSYITKPFNSHYLLMRVVKLLEQREILHSKFAKEPGLVTDPALPDTKDNDFIKQINLIIEKNIGNADFSIDHFYENMSMGRTLFYKKVKSLTGFTPNEYLRVVRMKKAAELLRTTQLNVSEVAFKVGNNNPFYFSKCFKEQFGISPSEFAKGQKPEVDKPEKTKV